MSNYYHEVQVLLFMNAQRPATIVTDGEVHKSFELEHEQEHPTLYRAIAYLEVRGYQIVPDKFYTQKGG